MKIGVQLYTVRDDMAKDPEGTLQKIGQMGYRFVETAGFAGRSAKEFAKLLADNGLSACGMHVGLEDCESNLSKLLEDATALNCPYLIVPWVPESAYKDGWDRLGERLQAIGERVGAAGKGFAYHNHAFEFVDVQGKTGFDILFSAACPDCLLAEMDLWWAYCGMRDPAGLLKRHGHRTKLVHLKDGKSPQDSVHAAAGDGVMPWDAVLATCREAKVEYGVVELDTSPGPALESVKKSLAFFRSKGFKD
jgi:sugar phosphate isomerase/epimerase